MCYRSLYENVLPESEMSVMEFPFIGVRSISFPFEPTNVHTDEEETDDTETVCITAIH